MELKEYWPRFLQDLFEFGQIADAEQPECTQAVQDIRSAPDDFFLFSLSEYGCERWEAILGLTAAPGDTLEGRRERILIKYLNHLPYTWRTLLSYLQSIDPKAGAVLEDYRIQIDVELQGDSQREDLQATLRQMIPANLLWILRTAIRQKLTQPVLICASGLTPGIITHKHQPGERS